MDPITLTIALAGLFELFRNLVVIFLLCWIVVEVCREIGKYLREKRREFGVLYKRKAIDELIVAANKQEVKDDLRRIREAHEGLLVPLAEGDAFVEKDICVVSAKDNMVRDEVADYAMMADDDSYSALG